MYLIIPGGKTHSKDNSENDETGYLQSGVETGGKGGKKKGGNTALSIHFFVQFLLLEPC